MIQPIPLPWAILSLCQYTAYFTVGIIAPARFSRNINININSPFGKVVFVDYHAPAPWHPLRGFIRQIFTRLEPFAQSMWHHRIQDFAGDAGSYAWRTETCFGGLFQKTVASCRHAR